MGAILLAVSAVFSDDEPAFLTSTFLAGYWSWLASMALLTGGGLWAWWRGKPRKTVRRHQHGSDVKAEVETITPAVSSPECSAEPSDHFSQPLGSKADQLERLVLPLLPDNKMAAIKVYRAITGASLAQAKAVVEAMAREHNLPTGRVPQAAHMMGIIVCLLGIVAIFQPFLPLGELQVLTLRSLNEHRTTGASIAQVFGYESSYTITIGLILVSVCVMLIATGAIHSFHLWRGFLLILGGMGGIVLMICAIRSSGYDNQSADDFRERDTASGHYGFVLLGEHLTVNYTWPEKFQVGGETVIVSNLPGGMGPPPGLTRIVIQFPAYLVIGMNCVLIMLGTLQMRTGNRAGA
jgi:hypothetical protein